MSVFGTHSPDSVGKRGSPAEASSPKRDVMHATCALTAHAGHTRGWSAAEAAPRASQEHLSALRTPCAWVS
eukprot:6739896-Lingulodinium_polyedra.AAC.1